MTSIGAQRQGSAQAAIRAVDPVIATYGIRLVTPKELRIITGYGSAKWRQAADDGHLTMYGTDNRPKYELGEVLEFLKAPPPRLTRQERLGAGARLRSGSRVPFAA